MVNNDAIAAAMVSLKSQEAPNFGATARLFGIDRTTLRRRFKGEQAPSSSAHVEAQGNLSCAMEKVLVERINTLSARGLPPTSQFVRNLVQELSGAFVGSNWVGRFVARHDDQLCAIFLDSIDYSRRIADNSRHFQHYFDYLTSTISKHHIRTSEIYNMDEKGFLIGLCNCKSRIVSKKMLANKKLLGASQDGSREFITLIACICANGTSLPPALIYEGKSLDLQDTWLEDFDASEEEAYFAASERGWTNHRLGLAWLEQVFLPRSGEDLGMRNRLLVLDGHSSHVNWEFIEKCDQNRVILGVLPPHSTHRLQPLDLKIFSPMSTAYSNEIDALIQSSAGFSRMTKRSFWKLFRIAWKKAVTPANICSAFAAAGIYPLDPSIVLNQISFDTFSDSSDDDEHLSRTPTDVRAVRRCTKALKKADMEMAAGIELIVRAAEKISIQKELLEHENIGLRNALILEQKRRKRGKKMGILDPEEPGQAVFASPGKIATIRANRIEEEAQKAAAEEEKEREKEAKAAERVRKAREVEDRREARREMAAQKKAEKEAAAEAKRQQKEANAQVRAEEQAMMSRKKSIGSIEEASTMSANKSKEGGSNPGHVRSGRNISLPSRFRD